MERNGSKLDENQLISLQFFDGISETCRHDTRLTPLINSIG